MRRSDAWSWKAAKRWMYLIHRWTGIALCILFAVWFISGVVMMYVPFPSFRQEERVSLAPPIDWSLVRHGPDSILAKSGIAGAPDDFRLGMTGGEPVWRLSQGDMRRAWSATSGQEITDIDRARAVEIAEIFSGAPAAQAVLAQRDQWVVTKAYARIAPFWKVRLDDGKATDLYVTRATGEIVQNTDRVERFWNWLGAVPHWIYFEFLRIYQEPWRQVVIWTSGIGIVGSILGVWIGILRTRLKRRYASGSTSPYRGWMKWHHITGLIGGLFVITWTVSGWWSMSPFGGFPGGDPEGIARRYAGEWPSTFGTTDLDRLSHTAANAREVRVTMIGGAPVILALDGDGTKRAVDGVTAEPVSADPARLIDRARHAVPAGELSNAELLRQYDLYWYSTGDPRSDARPLPVLRLTFDDPSGSWLHIDPRTGELLGQSDKGRRGSRWLFNALHSFDFPILLRHRIVRDVLMIVLSLFGLIVSVSGIVVGWRHLARPTKRRTAVESG